ncbi:dnaJsubfamily C member 14-like, partial [Scleropages formosus]
VKDVWRDMKALRPVAWDGYALRCAKECPGDQAAGMGGSRPGNIVYHELLHPCQSCAAAVLESGEGMEDRDRPVVKGDAFESMKDGLQDEEIFQQPAQEQTKAAHSLNELENVDLGISKASPSRAVESGECVRKGSCHCVSAGEAVGSSEVVSSCQDTSTFQQEESSGTVFEAFGESERASGRQEEEEGKFPGHSKCERDFDDKEEQRVCGGSESRDSRTRRVSSARRSAGGKRGQRRSSGVLTSLSGDAEQSQQAVSFFSKLTSSSGGRQRQARRRTHQHHQGALGRLVVSRIAHSCHRLLADFLCPWCLSCVAMVVDLIVMAAHRCGEGVEAAGLVLCNSCSQLLCKATDLPAMKAEASHFLQCMSCAVLALTAWTVGAATWGYRLGLSCLRVFHMTVLLGSVWLSGFLGKLGGERGRQWWASLWHSRVFGWVTVMWEKARSGSQESPSTPKPLSEAGRVYAGQELERLLTLAHIPEDELDPFAVLGVEADASDPELKRAYRQLAVLVHPDKNKHPSAGDAFKVLRAAWDIVSNPETRREYQMRRMAESELSKSMNEFLAKLQEDLKEAMNTMMCTRCEGKHRRFEMERDPSQARFCAECNTHHSAEEGDFWAESSMLGLRITYFALIDGKVYDITEWAGCQRIGISPDSHRVPYHISFGSKNSSSATRHKDLSESPPGPASPADLQDFFNRIFQGTPSNGMGASGGFFPNTPPPHQPRGPAATAGSSFTTPPSQTGSFGPGGPRSEGAKATRRRKKVRRPFQR